MTKQSDQQKQSNQEAGLLALLVKPAIVGFIGGAAYSLGSATGSSVAQRVDRSETERRQRESDTRNRNQSEAEDLRRLSAECQTQARECFKHKRYQKALEAAKIAIDIYKKAIAKQNSVDGFPETQMTDAQYGSLVSLYELLALTQYYVHRYYDAKDSLRQAKQYNQLCLSPQLHTLETNFLSGMIALLLGDTTEVNSSFAEVLRLNQDNTVVFCQAYVQLDANAVISKASEIEKEISGEIASTTTKLLPLLDEVNFYAIRAWAYLMKGEFQTANEYFKKASECIRSDNDRALERQLLLSYASFSLWLLMMNKTEDTIMREKFRAALCEAVDLLDEQNYTNTAQKQYPCLLSTVFLRRMKNTLKLKRLNQTDITLNSETNDRRYYEPVLQIVSRISKGALKYQSIPGDGHCLYNAVALYLGKDYEELREEVAQYIEGHLDEYRDIITGLEGGSRRTVEQYIKDVRSGTEWADHLEISVLMKIFNRPIVVVDPNGKIRNLSDVNHYSGEPIFVYYNGSNHYDGLLLTQEHQGREVIKVLTQPDEQAPTVKLLERSDRIGYDDASCLDTLREAFKLNSYDPPNLRLLSALENTEARAHLAYCYFHAFRVKGNKEKAVEYAKAAATHHSLGRVLLGLMSSESEERDSYFKSARETVSDCVVAAFLKLKELEHTSIPEERQKILAELIAMGHDGHQLAQIELAKLYAYGRPGLVPVDNDEAKEWIDRAVARVCHEDYPLYGEALRTLAQMYLEGKGGRTLNVKEAHTCLLKAAAFNDWRAKVRLAELYFNGKVHMDGAIPAGNTAPTQRDREKEALELWRQVRDAGLVMDGEAEYQLGKRHFFGKVVEKNDRKSMDLFNEAIAKGHIAANYFHGAMLFHGWGVPKPDWVAALTALRLVMHLEAFKQRACFLLGAIYFYGGNGVNVDNNEAIKYLACVPNYKPAAAMLASPSLFSIHRNASPSRSIQSFSVARRNNPSMAINSHGDVVLAYEDDQGVRLQCGTTESDGLIKWEGTSNYYSKGGQHPSVSIDDNKRVVLYFEKENKCYYHVGKLENGSIRSNSNFSRKGTDGVRPSVITWYEYVIEVHESENYNNIYYKLGKINEDGTISWLGSPVFFLITAGTSNHLMSDARFPSLATTPKYLICLAETVKGAGIAWEVINVRLGNCSGILPESCGFTRPKIVPRGSSNQVMIFAERGNGDGHIYKREAEITAERKLQYSPQSKWTFAGVGYNGAFAYDPKHGRIIMVCEQDVIENAPFLSMKMA